MNGMFCPTNGGSLVKLALASCRKTGYSVGMKNLDDYFRAEVGNMAKLARALGVTHAAVWQWDRARIPATRVLQVERITGISRHDLRPDLYPRDEVAA